MSDNNQGNLSEANVLAEIRQQLMELDSAFSANPEWNMKEAGLDSFSLLSFALSLEQRYGFQFSGDDLQNFSQQTAEGITRLVLAQLES